jgi:integrase
MNMTAVEINFPRDVQMPGFSRPCSGARLPRGSGKRIVRAVLKPEQVVAIAKRLPEPYSTLVLLAGIGLRIGESIGIKWSDFDGDVLKIQRRIYEGEADDTKTEDSNRSLPIPASLLQRLRALGRGDWIFRSRANTPINPGNPLKRHIRPVTKALGTPLGSWRTSVNLWRLSPIKLLQDVTESRLTV